MLFGWNRCVARNDLCQNPAGGFDTESERGDIDNKTIDMRITREDRPLESSANGNSFVWVDAFGCLLIEVLFDELLNFGNASRASNENDLSEIQ